MYKVQLEIFLLRRRSRSVSNVVVHNVVENTT